MDFSPPGFYVHGILQARILEWDAISYSRESFWSRDRTHVSCKSIALQADSLLLSYWGYVVVSFFIPDIYLCLLFFFLLNMTYFIHHHIVNTFCPFCLPFLSVVCTYMFVLVWFVHLFEYFCLFFIFCIWAKSYDICLFSMWLISLSIIPSRSSTLSQMARFLSFFVIE